ncbi:SRPBCC family protein [Arthrobacter sp. CAU 1506]|uniref:SRPBCC family protein n=1 Tax=Arthrobacter sp. CAU 1506 TaxID=2560052 RepID=UPI00197A8E0B|nr:SRPBCC family protein [Arthrobacter sp. CAU 1506]
MQLERTFSVTAPIGTVWDTLMDFDRVAGCIPGAQILEKTSDDEYQVGMKVKLGPVTMQYKGTLYVIERDAAGRRAQLQGKARETRGQGAAEATVTMQLSESGAATEGSVNADLTLSGKAAAMGKSVIGSVTDQMLAVFTKNLQEMISAPETNAAGNSAEATPASAAAGSTAAGSAGPSSTAPSTDAPSTASSPTAASSAAASSAGSASAAPSSAATSAGRPSRSASSSAAQPKPGSAAGTAPGAPPSSSSPAPAAARAGQQGGSSMDGLALAKQVLADQLRSPGKVLGLVVVAAAVAHLAGRRSGRRQAVAILRSGGV